MIEADREIAKSYRMTGYAVMLLVVSASMIYVTQRNPPSVLRLIMLSVQAVVMGAQVWILLVQYGIRRTWRGIRGSR